MTPERWRRIEGLYHAAVGQEPDHRAAFLAKACQGDEELLREVESLVQHRESGANRQDQPAVAGAGEPIEDREPRMERRLEAGAQLGPYRIAGSLGAGGMGEVYRATDTRLGRTVAIKVLRALLSVRDDTRQRFEREARAISALNHPNICGLYDICEFDRIHFLVMEYVEGETLAARLRRGALPFEVVLDYGALIADALAAAHSKYIVHRDLKPSNIMITRAGVKLLDFGLAKTVQPAFSIGDEESTKTEPLTAAGMIVGTPAYMAPEQVEGRPCDPRTDIFALGLVLYEMATGRRAFPGENKASLIAASLRGEPAPMDPPAPREFDHVVRRCLAKNPDDRWQAVSDVRRELDWVAENRGAGPLPQPARGAARRANWIWPVVTLASVAAVSLAVLFSRSPARSERPVEFSFAYTPPPTAENPSTPVPSPDGAFLAFTARDHSGKNGLWLRRLDSSEPHPLPETEDSSTPIWSADSRWIGFYSQGKLKKISPGGGRPQTIAEVPGFFAGSWNAMGDIVFALVNRGPLFHIRDSGGAPRQITQLDRSRSENSHRSPKFLPDGRRFLYLARCAQRENNALYAGSLDSEERTRLISLQSNAEYVSPGSGNPGALLFVREGTLFAQPFDGRNLRGDPMAVMESVEYFPSSASALFAASADGRVLVYGPATSGKSQFLWFDRAGNVLGRVGAPAEHYQLRLSPDSSRVVFNQPDNRLGNRDIWYIETARGVTARLTAHQANDWFPVWSPDGKRLLFASDRGGGSLNGIYEKKSMNPGDDETAFLIDPKLDTEPSDWSRDGRWILFCQFSAERRSDIGITPATGERKPFVFVATPADERFPRFSPDGKWIAYQSNETGRYEVYVRPFDGGPGGPEGRIQLSDNGGEYPAWRADGQELFFLSGGNMMHSLATKNLGRSGGVPRPSRLFTACPETMPLLATASNPYDVGSDGRFLISCRTEPPGQSRVLINWMPVKIAPRR